MVMMLSTEAINRGIELIKALDEKMPLWGALWILQEESNTWRFWVITPRADSLGPKWVYEVVQKCMRKMTRSPSFGIGDVIVTSHEDPLAVLIGKTISTAPATVILSIRFTGNYVHGVFVKDAYIYRLDMSGESDTSASDSEKIVVPYRGYEIVLRIRKTKKGKWHAFVFVERGHPDWHSSGSYDAGVRSTREGAIREGAKAGEAVIDNILGGSKSN